MPCVLVSNLTIVPDTANGGNKNLGQSETCLEQVTWKITLVVIIYMPLLSILPVISRRMILSFLLKLVIAQSCQKDEQKNIHKQYPTKRTSKTRSVYQAKMHIRISRLLEPLQRRTLAAMRCNISLLSCNVVREISEHQYCFDSRPLS